MLISRVGFPLSTTKAQNGELVFRILFLLHAPVRHGHGFINVFLFSACYKRMSVVMLSLMSGSLSVHNCFPSFQLAAVGKIAVEKIFCQSLWAAR